MKTVKYKVKSKSVSTEEGLLWDTDTTSYSTQNKTKEVVSREAVDRQRDYIDNFAYMLKTIGPVLKDLVANVVTVPIPGDQKVVAAKMETLAKVFNALGAFGSALSEIGDMNWQEARDKVEQIAFMFGEGYKDIARTYLLEAFAGMDSFYREIKGYKLDKVLPFLTTIFDKLKPFLNSLRYLPSGMSGAGSKASELALAFKDYAGDFTQRNVQPLIDAISVFSKVSDHIEKHSTGGLSKVNTFIQQVLKLTPKVTEFSNSVTAAMWEPLIDVVNAFNELGAEMGAAQNIVSIEKTLRRVGKALKVNDSNIRIERGDVTVQINLKINLNASVLATTLIQNSLVLAGYQYTPPGGMANLPWQDDPRHRPR